MPVNKNVLLIALDDGSAFDMVEALGPLHYYGFDQFFGESVHFREAYSAVALCQPSREAIMRGTSPLMHNINNNNDDPWKADTRPETRCSYKLKREGWFCSTGGKIYHGYFPLPGWVNDILYSETPNYISMGPGNDRPHVLWPGSQGTVRGFTDPADEDSFYDMKSRNDCLAFLRREAALHTAGNGRPWYREFGLHAPHTPYDTPNRFKTAYNVNDFAAPGVWSLGFPMSDFASNFLNDHVLEGGPFDAAFRGSLLNFASTYSMGFECIAQVLAELRAGPFWNNTMVIVFSDHGSHLGSNRRWHKFTTWRAAARAPLLIRIPDGVMGREVTAPVSLVDIFPTIYDWLGLPAMAGCPGRSLLPILMGGGPPANRWVPTFWFGQASATNGRDRITFAPDEGSIETFDNSVDLWDQNNLGRDHPRFGAIESAAREEFKRWGASVVTPGGIPDPGMPWHLYASREHGGIQADASFSTMRDPGATRPEVPGHQIVHFYADADSRSHHIPRGVDFVRYKIGEDAGDTTLLGGAGDKTILMYDSDARSSTTYLTLEGGNNFLNAESGKLVITAGPGNDTLLPASSSDLIDAGGGDDSVDGGGGHDTIRGGPGNDTLLGNSGNDLIFGGPGDDSVHGGDGNDTLHADSGQDTLRGGAGSNTFVIYRTERTQTIVDLTSSDTIDLSAWAPIQPVRVTQVGADVEITAALERVVCQKTTTATVRSRISGATLAP